MMQLYNTIIMEDTEMSDFLTSNTMLMLEKSMNFQWTKQNVLLDNIANAETPNYKVKYVTFEDALNDRIQAAALEKKSLSNIRNVLSTTSPTIRTNTAESTRMDGNSVNVTEQTLEMVRNAYQMQYVFNAISTDFSILRSAIRG